MQICQFLIGVSYAATHSFISYPVPIQILNVERSVAGVASAASTAVSSIAATASETGIKNLIKKLLLRAAGVQGVAENVDGAPALSQVPSLVPANLAQKYRTEYQTVPCIDTSGQTFAIWLNVLYLAPLTVLFVRFFIKSYLRRSGKGSTYTTEVEKVEKAGKDALKGVGRELYHPAKANGKSPNGNTHNGQSPNGKAANGQTINGKATNGN